VKEQFSGRGERVLLRWERREMVARKCSGRSWVGGVVVVVVVVGWGVWSLEAEVEVGVGEKGVRSSEGGIRGNEAVEKR
jgi:hypothetical protein